MKKSARLIAAGGLAALGLGLLGASAFAHSPKQGMPAGAKAHHTEMRERLPAWQKSALLLVHFQELSGREASEILDISVEALESALTRARRNLRDYLAHEKDALIGGSEP